MSSTQTVNYLLLRWWLSCLQSAIFGMRTYYERGSRVRQRWIRIENELSTTCWDSVEFELRTIVTYIPSKWQRRNLNKNWIVRCRDVSLGMDPTHQGLLRLTNNRADSGKRVLTNHRISSKMARNRGSQCSQQIKRIAAQVCIQRPTSCKHLVSDGMILVLAITSWQEYEPLFLLNLT